MNQFRRAAAIVLGTLAVVLTACGGATGGSEISVSDARVPMPAGANGAAYMTVTNDGDAGDRLVSATSDIAEDVELHESTTDGGSMMMQQIDGIDIPAGGEAVLEPGGFHVMLIGVTEELTEDDTVDLTLTFENAGERTVSAEVVPLGDLPEMDMGSGSMEGMEMDSE